MSDRLAQARAEAERRYPGGQRRFTEANLQAAFRQGWLAADANPQPHTLTADMVERALREDLAQGGYDYDEEMNDEGHLSEGDVEYARESVRLVLAAALGIEVEGDEWVAEPLSVDRPGGADDE